MKNKRTALSRATKIFLATSAIALSATVMAQLSEMTIYQSRLNHEAQVYLQAHKNPSPEEIQTFFATRMGVGNSAQDITTALLLPAKLSTKDIKVVIATAIKQGGNPTLVGSAAYKRMAEHRSKAEAMALVTAAGGDVSGTPFGAPDLAQQIMAQVKSELSTVTSTQDYYVGIDSAIRRDEMLQGLLATYPTETVVKILLQNGVPPGKVLNLALAKPGHKLTWTPEGTKAFIETVSQLVGQADPEWTPTRIQEAVKVSVLTSYTHLKDYPGASELLEELSKLTDPVDLAAIANTFSTASIEETGGAKSMNFQPALEFALKLGISLEKLTTAVFRSGAANRATAQTHSFAGPNTRLHIPAVELLTSVAGNSEAAIKAMMAGAEAVEKGNSIYFFKAAILGGADPSKFTEVTASGSPSPAPAPSPVADTPADPSPSAFGGSSGSTISGGGGGGVSSS